MFNASSLFKFNKKAKKEILNIVSNPEKLRNRLFEIKKWDLILGGDEWQHYI
jgi:hypothetical protein